VNERLPYFRSSDRINAFHAQLVEWRGTRWAHAGVRPNEMRCGVTGDCLFWVHVFKAIGALPATVEVPEYIRGHALRDAMAMLRERIEGTGRAVQVDYLLGNPGIWYAVKTGDVLLFKNGTSGVHCGLVIGEHPVHFTHLSQDGLITEPLNQKQWLGNLAVVYRLMEADPETTGGHRPPLQAVTA